MKKKPTALYIIVAVDPVHRRLNRLDQEYTSRDISVIAVHESLESAMNYATHTSFDTGEYIAIEETQVGVANQRKILRWYRIANGTTTACDAPEDYKRIASLTL
jgi:hypothetical protein